MSDGLARFVATVAMLALVSLGGPARSYAKCAFVVVDVKAQVTGGIPDEFEAILYSRPEGTSRVPVVNRETGEVAISLAFDSFKSLSLTGKHNCSRKPKELGIRVTVGGVERAKIVMLFPEHFVEGSDGHWTNRRPVTIKLGPRAQSGDGPHNKALQLTRSAMENEFRGPRS